MEWRSVKEGTKDDVESNMDKKTESDNKSGEIDIPVAEKVHDLKPDSKM